MRFQVPQFIEIEDKIFGPLTFKQFVYLAGAGGMAVVAFVLLPKIIAIFVSIPIIVLGILLAFYKVNNKPFINMVEYFFKFTFGDKLYLWKKHQKEIRPSEKIPAKNKAGLEVPTFEGNKLGDMNWKLDVSDDLKK